MFSGFTTARKAVWLKWTQLECASDRKMRVKNDARVSPGKTLIEDSESIKDIFSNYLQKLVRLSYLRLFIYNTKVYGTLQYAIILRWKSDMSAVLEAAVFTRPNLSYYPALCN